MIGIQQVDQLFTQLFDLFIIQNPDARQIAVFPEKPNLLVAQPVAIPTRSVDRRKKQIADQFVMRG
jgi:hypothetical protein